MKKVNFNQLQNFEVPQEWIDKAMKATPQKPPFLRRPYVIGSMIGLGVILTAVVVLVLINPFQKHNDAEHNGLATATEATVAVQQNATEQQAAVTEAETTVEGTDAVETEHVDETKAAEKNTAETTAAKNPEKNPEPETTADSGDVVKYRVKDQWYVDNRSERSEAPAMNDTDLELEKSELFTGDITIVISPNSPFYDAKEIRMAAYGVYSPTGQEVYGSGYLAPYEAENGDKIIRINLFDEGAYTPSANGYTFSFNFFDSDTDKSARDMVTVDLIGSDPVMIAL